MKFQCQCPSTCQPSGFLPCVAIHTAALCICSQFACILTCPFTTNQLKAENPLLYPTAHPTQSTYFTTGGCYSSVSLKDFLHVLCTPGIELSLHYIDQRETAPPTFSSSLSREHSLHAQDMQILLEATTIFGCAWFLKRGEACKLKIPTLFSLSPPHSPRQRLPGSRANNNLPPNRTGFTTASCFPSTSCSCSPLPDSPLASASPVSRYPQTCSCAAPHVIAFGSHSCLPDSSFPPPLFAPPQLLEPPELTSDPSAAEPVMLPLWPSLMSMRCQSLFLPVPVGRGAVRGGFLHTSLRQAPILLHMLISWLPLHSQPFLLSSSLPRTFRSYWCMFVRRILESQGKGNSSLFPSRKKISILTGLQ